MHIAQSITLHCTESRVQLFYDFMMIFKYDDPNGMDFCGETIFFFVEKKSIEYMSSESDKPKTPKHPPEH